MHGARTKSAFRKSDQEIYASGQQPLNMVDILTKRLNVYVLGPSKCGKTSLINALIKPAPQHISHPSSNSTSALPTSETADSPSPASISSTMSSAISSSSSSSSSSSTQDRVVVHHWRPGCLQNCPESPNASLMKETLIQIWDLPGNKNHQEAHFVYVKTPCLILLLSPADDDQTKLTSAIGWIQDKCPGAHVIIALTMSDHVTGDVGGDAQKELTKKSERIIHDVRDDLSQRGEKATQHVTNVASQIKSILNDQFLAKISDGPNLVPSADSLVRSWTERVMSLAGNPVHVHEAIFDVSTVNGMGLPELRKTIIDKTTNPQIFPHLAQKTPETLPLILADVIEAGRRAGDVLYTMEDFRKAVDKRLATPPENYKQIQEIISSLEKCDIILVLPGCNPSSGAEDKDKNDNCEVKTPRYADEAFVCIDPEAFANMVLDCLILDESKTFRLEANRFWPKESGFKPPDPDLLARVLECLPEKGIIREAVLPLLWQNQDLSQVQILDAVRCLQALGVLVSLDWAAGDYAGLAMPHYPGLSPVVCHGSVFMNLLPGNKPQLNWTSKPFADDVQITWRLKCITPLPYSLCARCLAVVKGIFQSSVYYNHIWDHGLLLKFTDATVCLEKGPDYLDVACRVNGEDLALHQVTAQVIWSYLVPVIDTIRRFLANQIPGLISRTVLLLHGSMFYIGQMNSIDQDMSLVECLTKWQGERHAREGLSKGKLPWDFNLSLLFPFEADNIWTVDDWISLVLERRHEVLRQTEQIFPHVIHSPHATTKRPKSRLKQTKRRKAVEVKWKNKIVENLETGDSPQEQQGTENNLHSSVANGNLPHPPPSNSVGSLASQRTATNDAPEPQGGKDTGSAQPPISHRKWLEEATALANRFVSSVMAAGVADYVASHTDHGADAGKIIGTAKVTAARVTADAALAVQNGDLEGAALAVMKAVQAVQSVAHGDPKDTTTPRNQRRSSLCSIL